MARTTALPPGYLAVWVLTSLLVASAAQAATLEVGPGKPHSTLGSALGAAGAGDTILVHPGTYGEAATISKTVVIRGVLDGSGGRPHFRSSGQISNGKGIFVVRADAVTIENLEFSGAQVADRNGAGIRWETGTPLTVRNSYFHDNENGILSGSIAGDIVIENSIFEHNGHCNGACAHNMYIGNVRSFTLKGSLSKGANQGHLVKSRAQKNYILYNKIIDDAASTASYKIDLPNGGLSYVIGNYIRMGPSAGNTKMIAFGMEGVSNPGPQNLYVIHNTLVDDKGGTFAQANGGTIIAKNNILVGGGSLSGANNVAASLSDLVNPSGFDYRLKDASALKDRASDPGTGDGYALSPAFQYADTARLEARTVAGTALDPGAYEVGGASTTCVDNDHDGYGNPPTNCANPEKDCNDSNASIRPGIPDVCGDGLDNNCNARIDDGCRVCTAGAPCIVTNSSRCAGRYTPACVCVDDVADNCPVPAPTCADADRDGYGNPPANCAYTQADCNDNNPAIRPGAPEVCTNGVDDNCNSLIDSGDPACAPVQTCATDADRDGYKSDAACPAGSRDCADNNPAVYPGAQELCGNGLDDNCNSQQDEGCACIPTVCDGDCDGVQGLHCGGADCQDGNPAIRPNTTEVCTNLVDDDCDALIDAQDPACGVPAACATDVDGDGAKSDAACPAASRDCDDRNDHIKPGATEQCGNGVDEDCDGRDMACDTTCPGNIQPGHCASNSRLCLSNRTLVFNCFTCPCPTGQRCADNVCVTDVCEPQWNCGPWGPCDSGREYRTCAARNCPETRTKAESRVCAGAICGDGRLGLGEDCDGPGTQHCASLNPQWEGEARCGSNCRFDTSGCCTNEPPSGRRGPRLPRCTQTSTQTTPPIGGPDPDPDPQEPGSEATNDAVDEIEETVEIETPKAWYRDPLNIALFGFAALMALFLRSKLFGSRRRM